MFRLIGIPIIAVAAVLIYRGLRDHFTLPECDSERAVKTLSEVLKQLQLEPTRYAPIKTVSSSKDEVVCNAVLPLPDGGSVVADYSFYWQGNNANMKYSIHRRAAQSSALSPSPARKASSLRADGSNPALRREAWIASSLRSQRHFSWT